MEWISVDERLPKGEGDIVNVKRKSGEIVKAYYHRDCMGWLHEYCNFPWTHFQYHYTKQWIDDVTHWYPIQEICKE